MGYPAAMNDGIQVFAASIYKVGLIRYVDVPREVSKRFGSAAHVPVTGTVEGVPVRTTLVSRGKGAYRMAIHSEIRKKLRVDCGAVVEIAIQLDEESREPELPPALVLALRNAPKAQRRFRGITTALRRQIVRYLTAVKSQETLELRVSRFVARWERENPVKREKARKAKK
ncbi:MAG TPA: YdeI/OmpD-associated family protein [Candidatus Sulfotelmatobacter sp.]|nr:YdeI/OmpD-associated family protein [Candidatus Sulfotelmatobacter sp.]